MSAVPRFEALHKLASEGLVTFSLYYKGASVADFSLSELEEIYTVRSALENHATYLAAQRIITEELEQLEALLHQIEEAFQHKDLLHLLEVHHQFHASICVTAKQQRLCRLAIQHLELTDLYQRMALSLGRGAKDPVVEHKEILETLRRRDADAAGHLIHTHLQMTVSELLELFHEEQSDGGV